MSREKQNNELVQMYRDLSEIFDEEYEKRRLITPQNTAEKMNAKGYRKQSDLTPCDVCRFNPPSSRDNAPCTICPAQAK